MRLSSRRPVQNVVSEGIDAVGQKVCVNSGLFAVRDIHHITARRAVGRDINQGDVFQCFGIWREGNLTYVALSERGLKSLKGLDIRLFRVI